MLRKLVPLGIVGVLVWLVSGAPAPTGPSHPIEVEPRRHSSYPSAWVIYTFRHKEYLSKSGTMGQRRLYLLMPRADGRNEILLTRDELLEHYRVRPEQLERVPDRLPGRWLSAYKERQAP